MIPAAVRAAIAEHARAELPNEACGLLLLDGDEAVEYVPGENASPSPRPTPKATGLSPGSPRCSAI